ncbi:class F sortase [Herbiconiux liangxiaofengii]|uniref:class F sortase n=1 Tax=Herbiconiux liangxiaofengii TaxID=3342795 RepID=UPI0035B96EF7
MLLSGCAAGGAESSPVPPVSSPAATATPTPTPDAAAGATPPAVPVPDVPRADASLGTPTPTVPPVRVQVGDLGIDVSVAPEGVDDAGALALPDDPDIASWYKWGPSPWSEEGTTVIASHVDSLEYGLGQFARLPDATAGTVVTVQAADGREAQYTVQQVQMADKSGVDWASVFTREGEDRLVLITCGGEFDYDTGHYLSNVIVTAVPVP